VSFAAPLVLLGLLALPIAAVLYCAEQVRQGRAARTFVSAPLMASVAPRRAGWRRHAPYVLLALGLAFVVVAVARPQRSIAKPIKAATVMLVNDASDSMKSTDVAPSRVVAARRAALRFSAALPGTAQVGSIEFSRRLTLLQSPTTNRALIRSALRQIQILGGGTATGEALELALTEIKAAPKIAGKRPPGAIVLISDGASNYGVSPVAAAALAKRDRVKVYTIAIGTPQGTAPFKKHGQVVTEPVPVAPNELARIAAASGGRAYRATSDTTVNRIYTSLAKRLGQRHVERSLLIVAAVIGLALVAGGAALSLLWFGRLA
jgi:Ca-activated chloride channel family protein